MSRRALIRLALALVVLLVVAALAAVLLDRGRPPADFVRGGPLLPLDTAQIERLVVTTGGVQYRLERGPGVLWTMSGALHDWVDPVRLARDVAALDQSLGGPILPGTVREDRRYGFGAAGAVRLVVTTSDGRDLRLNLGETNPATGLVYASGAGRSACFMVEPLVRDLIAALPQHVRLQSLLPPAERGAVNRATVRRGGTEDIYVRHEDRWWLQVRDLDDPRLPPLARAYQARCADRRREDEAGLWVQADAETVDRLIYDVSGSMTEQLVPVAEAEARRAAWGLDEIWREVVLGGAGIDPDPAATDPDRLAISFAAPLDGKVVPALRRGNPLLARRESVLRLEWPAADLVDTRALTLVPLGADTVVIRGAGGVLLRAARDPQLAARFDGRGQWLAEVPDPAGDEKRLHNTVRGVVVDLGRLQTLAVLPASADSTVLREDERVALIVVWSDPPRTEVLHAGWLDTTRLAGGTDTLVPGTDEHPPCGLWRPRDGRLLQIPPSLVVTARNLRR